MADDKVVQEEQVSKEETTSKETEDKVEEKEQSKEQPFNEEQEARMQQLIAQATSTAKEEGREVGKREMQGIKDREVAEVNRKARLAESKVNAYETSFTGLDEDTRKDIELARLREQDKSYQSLAQEEAQRQQGENYIQQMNNSLLEEVRSWNIEPDDKRIDYASDATDYFTGRKRFTDSLQKIVRDNQKKAEEKQGEDFKNLESKLRKDLGLDSVDTTAGGGVSDSDAEFKKALGDGSIPIKGNKANYERAKKLGLAK